jgi:hypothetical protein
MNHRSRECHRWGRVWSIWWDSFFHHLDDQAKNAIGQWSSVHAQRPLWKIQELKKSRPQRKVAKWFYKICSMCENMTICVKIWLSLDICVKYAQCVKIWSFVWKFDFHWIFVWNMFNVWKYGFHCIFVWNMPNGWKYGHLMSSLVLFLKCV